MFNRIIESFYFCLTIGQQNSCGSYDHLAYNLLVHNIYSMPTLYQKFSNIFSYMIAKN